jgi:hypothetical protein
MLNKLLAQNPIPLGNIGGDGLGPFGNMANEGPDATVALTNVTRLVSSIIGVITVAAGIYFLFAFLIGGFSWITSGGDKKKLEDARDRITNGIIGLVIVVAGISVLALVGQFFGWDMLVNDPGTIIESFRSNMTP